MPEANYELGLVLDPLIDDLIEDLISNGWVASKNVQYGIPYIRIRRSGFYHIFKFDSWSEIPNLGRFPDITLLNFDKYWCWSALLDKWNPNTTGHLYYQDPDYYKLLRGVIRGLGTYFSFEDLRAAIYIVLWDPCKIRNSFAHIEYQGIKPDPSKFCPVCNPPSEIKKIFPDGKMPEDFLEGFLPLSDKEKDSITLMIFASEPSDFKLTEPIPLHGLKDRFQTEKEIRDNG